MLNEEKIKLMAEIASFEKREGYRIFPMQSYFESDYISKYLFRAFFAYTICAMLVCAAWVLYYIEELLQMTELEVAIELVKIGGKYYLIGLGIYLSLNFVVAFRRFSIARRGMDIYISKLTRLEKRYASQDKIKGQIKEGNRDGGTSRN